MEAVALYCTCLKPKDQMRRHSHIYFLFGVFVMTEDDEDFPFH